MGIIRYEAEYAAQSTQYTKALTASLTSAGILVHSVSYVLAAILSLAASGALYKSALIPTTASLTESGRVVRQSGKSLTATISSVGALITPLITAILTAIASFSGAVNRLTSHTMTATTLNASATLAYPSVVVADSPQSYWRLDESSGTTATDQMSANAGTYQGTPTLNSPGLLAGNSDTAVGLAPSSYISTTNHLASPGPLVFSLEAWFKTSVSSGFLPMFQYSTTQTGTSTSYDRHIYMAGATGIIYFGYWSGAPVVISTPTGYNDGRPHHIVGIVDSSHHLFLYIDGALVASNTSTGASTPQSNAGWWRIGGGNLSSSWPGVTGGNALYYWTGTLDEPAIYSYALTATQVAAHYNVGADVIGLLTKTAQRSVIGSFSLAGAVLKLTTYTLAGIQSFLGTSGRFINHLLTATASSAGVLLAAHTYAKLISAVLSLAGSTSQSVMHIVSAGLTAIGTVTRGVARPITASAGLAGTLGRAIVHQLSSSLTTVGSLLRSTAHVLTGGISVTGAIGHRAGKALVAALSTTGSTILFALSHLLSGSLSVSGSMSAAHRAVLALVGALSTSASFGKSTVKAAIASLTFTGADLSRVITHVLMGTWSLASQLNRALTHTLVPATLIYAGAVVRQFNRTLGAATLAIAGILSRVAMPTYLALINMSGDYSKIIQIPYQAVLGLISASNNLVARSLDGVMTMAGGVSGIFSRVLNAILNPTGLIEAIGPLQVLLNAVLRTSGSDIVKSIMHTLDGAALISSAAIQKGMFHVISATLDTGGVFTRFLMRYLDGALTLPGTLSRLVARTLDMSLQDMEGALTKTSERLLSATQDLNATISRSILIPLIGGLSLVGGSLSNFINHVLMGAQSLTGHLNRFVTHTLSAGLLNIGATLVKTAQLPLTAASMTIAGSDPIKKIFHILGGSLDTAGQLRRLITHTLVASAQRLSGAISRVTQRAWTASLTSDATIIRSVARSLQGVLNTTNVLTKQVARIYTVSLLWTTTFSKQTKRQFKVTLAYTGDSLYRQTQRRITAMTSITGEITRRVDRAYTATLSIVGAYRQHVMAVLFGSLTSVGSMRRSIGIKMVAGLRPIGAVIRQGSHLMQAVLSFVGIGGSLHAYQMTGRLGTNSVLKALHVQHDKLYLPVGVTFNNYIVQYTDEPLIRLEDRQFRLDVVNHEVVPEPPDDPMRTK